MTLTKEEFLATVDHSLLKPFLLRSEVITGLEFALEINPKAVCITPNYVALAKEMLSGTGIIIATVAGFPSGSHTTVTKVFEAARSVEDGATEVDMVISVGSLRSGEFDAVLDDITQVVRAIAPAEVKVILETAYLTDEEITQGTKLVSQAGAAFVKTSTGFAPTGATPHNIALMRAAANPKTLVKAAGGLNTYADCLAVIEAGADRIGISKTQAILAELDAALYLEPARP
jgi:deoxyribose-phosphate aldolase